MAAVFVPPSPQTPFTMSTRQPLANVPNGTNSPHRGNLASSKRSRAGSQLDIPYGQPPPKKQFVDRNSSDIRSPTKSRTYLQGPEVKVLTRRVSQPTSFEKKLAAVKDKEKQTLVKSSKNDKTLVNELDTVRQWQKHYRKAFPQFVFYFDGILEDVRNKFSKHVIALGAREEKFFSRLVTHVVTSRPIPSEISSSNPTEITSFASSRNGIVQTVNPTLLDRPIDPPNSVLRPHRRQDLDARKDQNNIDILHRARQMGIRIWALEKLQRMISVINEGETIVLHSHSNRNHNAGGTSAKGRGDIKLSQVLLNDRLNGTSDRDPSSWMKEIVMFKGPFIYVHDVEEKTRPVMVREYPKVAKRQDGAWPQFRSAPLGKCPFIEEDPSTVRREDESPAEMKQQPTANKEAKHMNPPELKARKYIVQEAEDSQKKQLGSVLKQAEPPKVVPSRPALLKKSSVGFIIPSLTRTGPVHLAFDPAASGVQPSHITSAIRSQMISSTAAVPGPKAGVSKEVQELKRKVLEKNNGAFSARVTASSHRTTDISQPCKTSLGVSTGSTRNRLSEKLGHIHEDTAHSEDKTKKLGATGQTNDAQKKKEEKTREPRSGYCENCREKFDDYDEHIVTRKHRRFALTGSNWSELDKLLGALQRPLRKEHQHEDWTLWGSM